MNTSLMEIMKKRGQMYIISAVILGIIIFGLANRSNVLEKKEVKDDFENIGENYAFESSEVINYGVNKDEKNLFDLFNKFTAKFLKYSGKKDDDVGVLYVLAAKNVADKNVVEIRNCLSLKGKKQPKDRDEVIFSCLDEVSSSISVAGLGGLSVGAPLPDRYSSKTVGRGEKQKIKIGDEEYDLIYEFDTSGENPKIGYVIIKEEGDTVKIFTNAKK